ncbi:hypothetical protein [Paracoccus aminophilus]|uniref:PepSY domain-containing protein n=1 Tax=Paracoccus aminophilus JCM 7686 TaxID=1367847 RepID=S5XM71_PARAH|nr:hypothetical protein [Paracoccus aminophilus]AGT08394.1 hypothetical protein JCM7686_1293 [Paracoccus aminophilus JCM 7686]
MLKSPLKIAATILKVGALTGLMAGAAFAQSTTVTTEGKAPESSVPLAYKGLSDVQITDFLTARGVTDISVARDAGKIVATGHRDGNAIELIYNEKTGQLVTVDGNSPSAEAHADFMALGEAPDPARDPAGGSHDPIKN